MLVRLELSQEIPPEKVRKNCLFPREFHNRHVQVGAIGVGWCLYLSWKETHFLPKYRHQHKDLHGECDQLKLHSSSSFALRSQFCLRSWRCMSCQNLINLEHLATWLESSCKHMVMLVFHWVHGYCYVYIWEGSASDIGRILPLTVFVEIPIHRMSIFEIFN